MMIVLVILLLVISIGLGVAYSMGLLTPKKEEEVPEVVAPTEVAPTEVAQEVSTPIEIVQPPSPSEPEVGAFPDDVPGLSGKYTFDSFDDTRGVWLDESGKGHHITARAGVVKKAGDYIFGGKNDGMKIPLEVFGPNDVYTMFWVARYNGGERKRIFDGMDNNWLSGFWAGNTGVAHHSKWLTPGNISIHGPHAWIQGTDSPNMFRTFGKNRVTDGTVYGTTPQITINLGASRNEKSDWAIKEIIFYNRLLRIEEVEKVEAYLLKKHFPELPENISRAKGYNKDAVQINDPRGAPYGYGTAEFCRNQAKELGYPIWAHRTEDHTNQNIRNKCFYYEAGAFGTYTEDTTDDSHVIGCVDEEVSVLEGCRDEI